LLKFQDGHALTFKSPWDCRVNVWGHTWPSILLGLHSWHRW
jgi:hypothetical protein